MTATRRAIPMDPSRVHQERATCARCRRPTSWCWCARLPQLHTKTRVLILQHPRERDVAIGTARMAHLALPASQLVSPRGVGVAFDEHPLVRALIDDPLAHAAVLFPGEGARDVHQWVDAPPRTLVVVDGTWWQAKKILTLNPRLAALPRVSYRPSAPGNYRIRREPSAECLATIEAIAAVLGVFEGDLEKFSSLLAPFTHMVDQQIEAARASRGGRHRTRHAGRAAAFVELLPLLATPKRAVVVYGEANACPRDARVPGKPELIHLVASRPATGERLEIVLRPRRALARSTAERIGLSEAALHAGVSVDDARARLRAFSGDDPLLVMWGPYARDLLAQEGEPKRGFVDLRSLAARALRASPGGIDAGARALGVDIDRLTVNAGGRAGRMLAILERVHAQLIVRARQ
jgi:DTW domain-containing protein YfiP